MFTAAEILLLIDTIYAGALDATAWEAAIAGLCRASGSEVASLPLHNARTKKVESAVFINVEERFRDAYEELTTLPDMQGTFRAVAEHTGEELMIAAPDLEGSRFHAEWRRPQPISDFLAVPLAPNPWMLGGLFIGRHRRGEPYGSRELDALRALRPHLVRAIQVRLRLDGAVSAARDALAALDLVEQAVLLVDAGAVVVHANRAADVVLRRGDGVTARHSVLACDRADDSATLHRLVGEASAARAGRPGGTLAVGRRSGRRPLAVLVAPLRGERPVPLGPPATAIVLIADPEAAVPAPGEALRATYGLTAAEARVAEALMEHERLADVAAKLSVSLATVRTLLQRAFDKTDTHRQADLVRLMLAHRVPAAPNGAAVRD